LIFDAPRECPAVIRRDEESGRLMAVWPTSWRIGEIARRPEIAARALKIDRADAKLR
jgi:hypothetical protein